MKTPLLLALLVLLTATAIAQQPNSSPTIAETVWTWSKQCDGIHRLGVTVRLERKKLYRGSFLICRGSRGAENGREEFHFRGGHRFQGEYQTHSTDLIECDIWQAGGEPDALILGLSFTTKKRVLLNTLHIASPDKQTSSELDPGLVITTYPVPGR